MTAFLIVYGKDPTDRFAAYAVPQGRTAAIAASLPRRNLVPGVPPGSHAGGCAYVVETEADVTFGGSLLVDVFKALTGESVKKFESRAVGVKRLLKALEERATPVPEPEPEPIDNPKEVKKMSDVTNGTRARRNDADVIRVTVDKNPKREGSEAHDRFALYRDGMTLAEYVAAGGRRSDLAYDTKHGFVTVEKADASSTAGA